MYNDKICKLQILISFIVVFYAFSSVASKCELAHSSHDADLVSSSITIESAREEFRDGVLNFSAGKYKEAVTDFSRTIIRILNALPLPTDRELFSDRGEWLSADRKEWIARVYFMRGMAKSKLKIGEYDTGIIESIILDFNNAVEFNPKYVEAYYYRGNMMFASDEFKKAIKDYSKVIELAPENITGYFYRSLAYMNLKQYELATADLSSAIELKPTNIQLYDFRALSNMGLKRYEQVIIDLNKVIEANPKHAEAYSRRGNSYALLGMLESAIKDYESALTLNPKDEITYSNLRNTRHNLKQNKKAVEIFYQDDPLLQINPEDSKTYH